MTLKPAILNTSEIKDALRAAMPDLVEVGQAADLGALTPETLRAPSAYVIALAETPGENRYQSDQIINQRVIARFGVVWVARDIADRMGARAVDDIRAVRAAGLPAVAQIKVTDAEGPCEPLSGRLVSGIGRDGLMLWQDDFGIPFNRHIPITGA